MLCKATRVLLVLGTMFSVLLLSGSAWAENGGKSTETAALRLDLRQQEEEMDRITEKLTRVGDKLEESQGRVDQATVRQREVGRRSSELTEALKAQKEAAARSRSRFEEQVKIAYKGGNLTGILLLVETLFDDDERGDGLATLQAVRLLAESSKSIQHYKDANQNLRATIRQVERSKAEYRSSGEQGRASVEELEGRESELRAAIEGLGLQRDQVEERLAQLEAEEEAGMLKRPPATRQKIEAEETPERDAPQKAKEDDEAREQSREQSRERELEIARDDIVSQPVEPIPYEEYVRLYKESAERYGFGGDWYVLAGVGKVESNHGENMGPSSAGAMGPMQFLPSTWRSYGVDGNGDGEANIMDPEDAIPAAASYLKAGGAPQDWYAALFTYNRADWYVEEVLAIAESYRRIHGDDSVGPYMVPASSSDEGTSSRYEPAPRSPEAPIGSEDGGDVTSGGESPEAELPEKTQTPPKNEPGPADDATDTSEETSSETEGSMMGGETTGRYPN